jgi:hypothetical protein
MYISTLGISRAHLCKAEFPRVVTSGTRRYVRAAPVYVGLQEYHTIAWYVALLSLQNSVIPFVAEYILSCALTSKVCMETNQVGYCMYQHVFENIPD